MLTFTAEFSINRLSLLDKANTIQLDILTSIRQKTLPQREQPSRASETKRSLKHDSAIGQHLLDNPKWAKAYSEHFFRIIDRGRSTFH